MKFFLEKNELNKVEHQQELPFVRKVKILNFPGKFEK